MSKTQHAYSIPTAHANPVKLLSMVGALRTEVTRGLSCLGVIIIKIKINVSKITQQLVLIIRHE